MVLRTAFRLPRASVTGLTSAASRRCATASAAAASGDSSFVNGASPHQPVLLAEVLEAFEPVHIKTFVDCTVGAAGHAKAVVHAHAEVTHVVGVDQDACALELAHSTLSPSLQAPQTLTLHHGNFRDLASILQACSVHGAVDAMLLDLGVSSMQLDQAERGFSFSSDGPLDMRMDRGAPVSAADIVNSAPEQELGRILRELGEEKAWKSVSRRIVDARTSTKIETTRQLVEVIGQTRLAGSKKRKGGAKGAHPATRTFQALRIAVNDELRACEIALPAAIDSLRPGGRLAVITFHSLEDRLVKWAMRTAAGDTVDETLSAREQAVLRHIDGPVHASASSPQARVLTKRPLVASDSEILSNPRARSAKLRVLEKL